MGIVSSRTPAAAVGKQDLPLHTEGALRKHSGRASTSTRSELHMPGSQSVRRAGGCKTCPRINTHSRQTLSCSQLFKSFRAVGSLPPVHLRNSGKFSKPWEESCQLSACFTATVLQVYSFLFKKHTKNQTCNHAHVCPANSDCAASPPAQPLLHLHTKQHRDYADVALLSRPS